MGEALLVWIFPSLFKWCFKESPTPATERLAFLGGLDVGSLLEAWHGCVDGAGMLFLAGVQTLLCQGDGDWAGALDSRSISATVPGARSCTLSLYFCKSQGQLNHSGDVCEGGILTVLVNVFWRNKKIYTYIYICYRNWLILDSS